MAHQLIQRHREQARQGRQHGSRKPGAAHLVMGQRLLRHAQLIGQCLLRQTVLFAGLCNACAKLLEKLFVVGVHGRGKRKTGHEGTPVFVECG